MAKTLIDIDDDVLAEVAEVLGTTTKKDTVDAALRKILADRRRADALDGMIQAARNGDFAEMLDPQYKMKVWHGENS